MGTEELGAIMARAAAASIGAPTATESRDLKALALARIPIEFRAAELSGALPWCDPKAIQRAQFARPGMVLLFGEAGSGKTTLGTALYRRELELGDWEGGAWIAANRMVIEATREVRLGQVAPLKARAMRASVLFLDDLGLDPQTDEGRATIDDVICDRHRRHRKTIVTTPMPAETLEKRYGAGVFRRLTEEGRAVVIQCRKRPEDGWGARL